VPAGSIQLAALSTWPLTIALIALGLGDQRARHRRLAWPIWPYLSVTSVLTHPMFHPLTPAPA
jgi:uncharacterized membrane protein YozB (DUF420 family)